MGDFVSGQNLEALLANLAEQHQPVFVPTAPDTRRTLPRLKVPSASEAAAAARTAASVGGSSGSGGSDSQPATGGADGGSGSSAPVRAACKAGDACTVGCMSSIYSTRVDAVRLPLASNRFACWC